MKANTRTIRDALAVVLNIVSFLSLTFSQRVFIKLIFFLFFVNSAYFLTKPGISSGIVYKKYLGFISLYFICIILLWGAFIYQHLFTVGYRIIGLGGMEPSIKSGDWVLVRKPIDISRGDVITYQLEEKVQRRISGEMNRKLSERQLGRVIGLPTESISIENGSTFINDRRIVERYVGRIYCKVTLEKMIIPVNHFFMMKDNRCVGVDSRHYGTIDKSQIESEIIRIYKYEALRLKAWFETVLGFFVLLSFISIPYFLYTKVPPTRPLKFILLFHSSLFTIVALVLLVGSFDPKNGVDRFPFVILPLSFYHLILAWLEFVFRKSWVAVFLSILIGSFGGYFSAIEIMRKLRTKLS